jgi:hypothetical protein
LVTGPDIIFFWVARMVFAGFEFKNQKPFNNVYFTGIVRDKQRRKMSKQLGNSPDPITLIEKHGADAVRVGLMLCAAAGNDLLFDESLCDQGKRFSNKIWNSFRLIDSWEVSEEISQSAASKIAIEWYQSKFQDALLQIDHCFEQYRISEALMLTYKLIFDDFCGSLLEILNARADLSRRAVIYKMQGFSFREFLSIETQTNFNNYTLKEILSNHVSIADDINSKVKVFRYFEAYLKSGYYPFYRENLKLYDMRLSEVINMILDIELPQLRQIEVAYIPKLKQLLAIIAKSVPFKPNVSKLSQKIVLNRQTLLSYINYLNEVDLTHNIYKSSFGISQLQKPDKIFLENTNLMFLLGNENLNTGNLRETFFVNQLSYKHQLNYLEKADFIIDSKYTFEIGGKDKSQQQIKNIENAYIAADGITYGNDNKIPLWLFGFLY